MNSRPPRSTLDQYPAKRSLSTRWMDNDIYGHLNNVTYYSFFDTAVNMHLIEAGVMDPASNTGVIGLVVESQCTYHAPLSFPGNLVIGLRVAHMGNSSVRYELAAFGEGSTDAAVQGYFVHVYVDAATRRPAPQLPSAFRDVLTRIMWAAN